MVAARYYNTSAAARQVNLRYNSVNGYASPQKPSNWGFGSCYDQVSTLNMPEAATFGQPLRSSPYPTDHNLSTPTAASPEPRRRMTQAVRGASTGVLKSG
jgi:hypothetical protein